MVKPIKLTAFKGINNRAAKNKLPTGYLAECVNFLVENSGILTQKPGYQLKDSGVYTGVWSDNEVCFAVKNGNLVELDSQYQATELGYSIVGAIDFAKVDGKYYFVSAQQNGIITENGVKSFGMSSVSTQPTLTATSGSLPAGTYLVAVTKLDASGMESGTAAPASITLTANQAIALSNIVVDYADFNRIDSKAIYVSACNGSQLFRQFTVSKTATTATISAIDIAKYPLNTVGISPAPKGTLICYHYGHLYIAANQHLFYSQTLQYERWKPANHFKYPSNIIAILSCENGLWVCTEDGLYWINGKTPRHGIDKPGDMTQVKKHHVKVKANTAQRIPQNHLAIDGYYSHAFIVMTDESLILLLDGGAFTDLTSDRLKLPAFTQCASAIIESDDSYHYLGMIQGGNTPTRTV